MSGLVRGTSRDFGRRYRDADRLVDRRNWAASARRCDRYLQARKQRRRGLAWAVVAAVILTGAWDLACRVDEVSYNEVSPAQVSETPYEAPHRIRF